MNRRTKRRLVLSSAIVGSIVVLAVGGYGVRVWYRNSQTEEARRLGLELYAARRFEEALQPLSLATRDTANTEIILALADARRRVPSPRLRHLQVASSMFAKVEALDPKNGAALDGQLECAIGLGYLDQIPEIARRLLALNPDSVKAREAILEVRAAQGRWEEVIRIAEELQTIEPQEVRWRAIQMQALSASGADAEGRLGIVDQWLREDPNNIGVSFLRADVLRALGRSTEAREVYASVARSGVRDARLLDPLLEGLESTGQESLIPTAIEASRPLFTDPSSIFLIEAERLLTAGRLRELETQLDRIADREGAEIDRFRAAAAYLSNDNAAARAIVESAMRAGRVESSQTALDVMRMALVVDLGSSTRRERLDEIRTTQPLLFQDPVSAIVFADLLIQSGEFDEAVRVLGQAFDHSGRRSQPVGLRLVKLLAGLERVPEALAVARDLGLRYQSDGAVAAAILEAWSGALQAGFTPGRVFGALASDSPDALYEYWKAMSEPRELGPLVAEVFARRGLQDRAESILTNLLARAERAEHVLPLVPTARRKSDAQVLELLLRAATLPANPTTSLNVATQLSALGQQAEAIALLQRTSAGLEGVDKQRIGRALRLMETPANDVPAQLARELAEDPSVECASFALARPEIWDNAPEVRARNAETVTSAIRILREALGDEAHRVVIAEATSNLNFYPEDQARIARSIAALVALERRTPDSVGVLATLARLFEVSIPPDPVRASEYLTRAVQLQPGSVDLYPELVRVLQETGEFEAASRAIDLYARLIGEDVSRGRTAATLLETQGDFASAAELRGRLSERTRETVDQIALARAKVRAGDISGAELILREILRGDDAPIAQRELTRLLASTGRVPEARELLEAANAVGGSERVDALRAEVEFAFGDLSLAETYARRAEAAQSLPANRLLLARILQRLGKQVEARELVVGLIQSNPEADGLLPVAATMLAGDKSESGRAALQRALEATSSQSPDFAATIELLDAATNASGQLVASSEILRAARQLTVLHSGSPLVWRLCAQLHAVAGQSEEAARLAMLAVSRLPSDESLAELAVGIAIAAGRIDDAAAVASAWRRITGANELSSRSAQAFVEMVRRNPAGAIDALAPMRATILSAPNADDALALFVSASVLAGRADQLETQLTSLPETRRGVAISAWIEAARALSPANAIGALSSLAKYVGPERAQSAIAVLTEFCADGHKESCVAAEQMLARLGPERGLGIPRVLLEADSAAANRNSDALAQYMEIIALALGNQALRGVPGRDGASIDGLLTSLADPEVAAKLREKPIALAALNNMADALRRTGGTSATPQQIAASVVRAIPESPEAADTLFRCALQAGDLSKARQIAEGQSDPTLQAVELAELAVRELAAKSQSARSVLTALQRLDFQLSRTGIIRWSLLQRVEAVRAAVRAIETGNGGVS